MISIILACFIALQHVGFALLEMVLWQKPAGMRIFANTPQRAQDTAVLALNQGLYNLFLTAGLIASVVLSGPTALTFRYFFMTCVAIAGVVGGITAKRSILFVQGFPAMIGLVVTALGW